MCTRTCRALHFSRSRDQVGVYPTGLAWRSHLMCTRTCKALHFSRSRDQVGVYLTSVAFSPDVYQDMQGVTFQQVTWSGGCVPYWTSLAFSPDVYQDMQGVTFQQVTWSGGCVPYWTSVAFSPDVYQDMQGVTFQQVTWQDVLKGKDGQTEMGVSDLCQHRHQGVQRVQAQHLQPQQHRTDVW